MTQPTPDEARLRERIEATIAECRSAIETVPGLASLLYDIDLLPEQLRHLLRVNPDAAEPNARRMATVCVLCQEQHAAAQRIAALEAEVARVIDQCDDRDAALQRIQQWSEAYVPDIFPPLTAEETAEARLKLGDALFSRLHSDWARHLTSGIGNIARTALTPEPSDAG